jgi:energy-coupling factor transport system ATP-binding protein
MSIRFKDIDFTYDEERKSILKDFSAEFEQDKITILTGVSGCGKSTLLYLAAGLYPHNGGILRSGLILVEGNDPEKLTPYERCRMVGMMFQNPRLQFCMDTVKNELVFCLENLREDPDTMDERIDEALQFCGIVHLKERKISTLSGGECQKVMLACIILGRPKWLLLDEPFANIDNASARDIATKLAEWKRTSQVGILVVDHRLDNWLAVADEIRIMENGQILPEKILMHSLDAGQLESHGIIVPGRSYPAGESQYEMGEPVLELVDVSVHYGKGKEKKEILSNVNATFCSKGIYAILGESGCGKSSLFHAMSGVIPSSGKMLLRGVDIKKKWKKTEGHIGFVTQNPQDQFVGGNVRDEIELSLKGRPDKAGISKEILQNIRLWRYREVSPYLLSQGQQRRLGVAALMAYDCIALICDEPTYAQDRNSTIAIMDAICRQARECGAVVIFSTHDPQLAKDYADVIYRLEGGKLYANMESGL